MNSLTLIDRLINQMPFRSLAELITAQFLTLICLSKNFSAKLRIAEYLMRVKIFVPARNFYQTCIIYLPVISLTFLSETLQVKSISTQLVRYYVNVDDNYWQVNLFTKKQTSKQKTSQYKKYDCVSQLTNCWKFTKMFSNNISRQIIEAFPKRSIR